MAWYRIRIMPQWWPRFSWNILQWRHNGRESVSNHQPHDCLLNRLFRRRSKKSSKLRVTGFCVGNSPGSGEFPAQMASNVQNVSIWWRHHDYATLGEVELTYIRQLSGTLPVHLLMTIRMHLSSSSIKVQKFMNIWYNASVIAFQDIDFSLGIDSAINRFDNLNNLPLNARTHTHIYI